MTTNMPDDDAAEMARLADAWADPNQRVTIGKNDTGHDGVDDLDVLVGADDGTKYVGPDWDLLTRDDDACPDEPDTLDPGDDGTVIEEPVRRERPQVGPWVRSRIGRAATTAGSHIIRSPWYTLRGTGETVRRCWHWVTATADADLRARDIKAANTLKARAELRRAYAVGTVARGIVAGAPIIGAWAWVQVGAWGLVPAVTIGATYVAMHTIGYRALNKRPEAVEAARHVTAKGKRPALSRPFITEALTIAGFEGAYIESATPTKQGERIVIDLPRGATVERLIKKHAELAGALGRPAECVVIEPREDVSPLRFELFIAHKRLAERGAPRWAWAKVKSRSFFDPVPVGIDMQGNPVEVVLPEVHTLIGGASGMGKSYTARLLLMAAAQDLTALLLIHNLKGGVDYKGFAPIAHTLRAGSSRADLAALADDLAWVQSEIARRGKILERLPSALVREGKLTAQVARDHDMPPVILLIDEAQRAFSGPVGETIAERLEDVVRTARAVGIKVVEVTQGTKEGAIPSAILDQLGQRFGHGVTNITDANLILGSDAHGRGYRAVDIDKPGVAYVGTAGGRMVRTMMAKVDLPDVERIVTEAAELRRKAGTLSGMAAGTIAADDHDGGTRSFLTDVLAVWPTADDGAPHANVWSSELAIRLTATYPDEYPDTDVNGPYVSRRLTDAGVKVGSQRMGEKYARGARHADVMRAHARE